MVREFSIRDGLEAIWLVGYSLGGNLVLEMAGEVGATLWALSGIAAVCPSIRRVVPLHELPRSMRPQHNKVERCENIATQPLIAPPWKACDG